MAVLILVVVAALLVAGLVTLAARSADTLGEVDRFHRARAMTTEWAKAYTGAPPTVADPDIRRRGSSARADDENAHAGSPST